MVNAPEQYAGDTTKSAVSGCTLASIGCTLVSVIIMSAYAPKPAPMTWPDTFLVASVVLLGIALVSLRRRSNFAWKRFFQVAKWVVLMTLIYGGMLEYVFIFDGMRGTPLAIMTVVLLLTAIDVPILWGFSVARHERVSN